jgi:hypothetical protein
MIRDAYDKMSASEFLGERICGPKPGKKKIRKMRKARRQRKALRRFLEAESQSKKALYRKHIESPHWKGLKIMIVAERGSVCERCGKPGPVDMHHVDYGRLGHELPQDLKLYCRTCHFLMHPEKHR